MIINLAVNYFGKGCQKLGTVYQDNNAYYEISAVRTFGASWSEISFAVYLKYQKSPVKFYTAAYVIPFDLVENANDIEDFKRVKAERIKDSQERFDLLYKKLITSTTHELKTRGLAKAQVD